MKTEEQVHEQMEQLQDELLSLLERTRRRLTEQGHPTFGVYLEIAALVEVLGVLMREAVESDPARARAWISETVRRFEVFVEPPVARPN